MWKHKRHAWLQWFWQCRLGLRYRISLVKIPLKQSLKFMFDRQSLKWVQLHSYCTNFNTRLNTCIFSYHSTDLVLRCYYPHMPIGKLWTYRLLFVCTVCMVTVSPPRIKQAASNFSRQFISVQGFDPLTPK